MWRSILNYLFPQREEERAALALGSVPLHIRTVTIHNLSVTVLSEYRQPHVRMLVHLFKYKHNAHATTLFATTLGDTLLTLVTEELVMSAVPVRIVPVPSSRTRIRERGYNHLEDLLTMTTTITPALAPLVHVHTISKVQHTLPQTRLNRSERLSNLRGTFSVIDDVSGAHIVLVDDVLTTGATLTELKRLVLEAGARQVSAVVLAH